MCMRITAAEQEQKNNPQIIIHHTHSLPSQPGDESDTDTYRSPDALSY